MISKKMTYGIKRPLRLIREANFEYLWTKYKNHAGISTFLCCRSQI